MADKINLVESNIEWITERFPNFGSFAMKKIHTGEAEKSTLEDVGDDESIRTWKLNVRIALIDEDMEKIKEELAKGRRLYQNNDKQKKKSQRRDPDRLKSFWKKMLKRSRI